MPGLPATASYRFLYIHGFNSSPASGKARAFVDYCREQVPDAEVLVPALSHDPAQAIADLEAICRRPGGVDLMVGSSLGGYYATWLSERLGGRAALVNPAVAPHRHLGEAFLGWHRNPYTGSAFQLTADHVAALAALECESLRHPENFLLLVQAGDEVLDYRLATALYDGARQHVEQGGDHGFREFECVLPMILAFAGIN